MAFSSESVRLFLAVLDHGSFSAAARALRRVPSAVSMAIGNLEAELDLQLFDRSGREPVPTAAARALEPEARAIADSLHRIEAHALSLHAGLERRLGLAVADELLVGPWRNPLAALAVEFPALEVEVISGPQDEVLRRLHGGEAALAVVFERPVLMSDHEAFREVGQEVLLPVAAPGHPLVAGAPPGAVDLVGARQIAVAGRDRSRIDPRLVVARQLWRTDSHLATLGLVEAGLGWAYLPRTLVQPLIAEGRLAEVALADMSNELRLWVDVVWRSDRPLGLGARRYIELLGRR
jgi:DNA-binding transcriptional LysR family regulator